MISLLSIKVWNTQSLWLRAFSNFFGFSIALGKLQLQITIRNGELFWQKALHWNARSQYLNITFSLDIKLTSLTSKTFQVQVYNWTKMCFIVVVEPKTMYHIWALKKRSRCIVSMFYNISSLQALHFNNSSVIGQTSPTKPFHRSSSDLATFSSWPNLTRPSAIS